MNSRIRILVLAIVVFCLVGSVAFARHRGGGSHRGAAPTHSPTPPPVPEDMVRIPGGTFTMGCEDLGMGRSCVLFSSELPSRPITLDAFFLDIHEVTAAEYGQCVDAGVCIAPGQGNDWAVEFFNWNKPDRENHPVNGVNWNQADTYCRWKKKRLPTEAEFEYALRGGKEELFFPWGNESFPPHWFGNFTDETYGRHHFPRISLMPEPIGGNYDDGYVGTAPVCTFTRNAYGLCDIEGNVCEWVSDWYSADYYQSSSSSNPQGPATGTTHVYRGGAWDTSWVYLRSSARFALSPDTGRFDIGFRCAK